MDRNDVSTRQPCCISIDMDPVDHYLVARGYEPRPETQLNAVYESALPRFLDVFDEFGIRATFFIVGKDADRWDNAPRIRAIVERGHEVASHSYAHEPPYSRLSRQDKFLDISRAHATLSAASGQSVTGFRTPGWDIDAETLQVLAELGYEYDSSVFPSALVSGISTLNWLLNRGRLPRSLGGDWRIGLAPKTPYRPDPAAPWKRGDSTVLEFPPTVLPGLQLPFLGTSLFFAGRRVASASAAYLRLFNRPVAYELHGIELLEFRESICDDRLLVKPGLRLSVEDKLQAYRVMFSAFAEHYTFQTMRNAARRYGSACES